MATLSFGILPDLSNTGVCLSFTVWSKLYVRFYSWLCFSILFMYKQAYIEKNLHTYVHGYIYISGQLRPSFGTYLPRLVSWGCQAHTDIMSIYMYIHTDLIFTIIAFIKWTF